MATKIIEGEAAAEELVQEEEEEEEEQVDDGDDKNEATQSLISGDCDAVFKLTEKISSRVTNFICMLPEGKGHGSSDDDDFIYTDRIILMFILSIFRFNFPLWRNNVCWISSPFIWLKCYALFSPPKQRSLPVW